MPTDAGQTYANHTRLVPGFHYATFGLILVYLLWTMYHAMTSHSVDAHFQILAALALASTAFYARSFPLKAQDRIIRLEEQLRLTRLLPDDLRSRVGELTPRQLIALRFASDAETPELVRWVLTETVTDTKAIKQRIKSWRADVCRV